MVYEIKTNLNTDKYIFSDNLAESRSYFIPFENKKDALASNCKNERYNSSKVYCLSGNWLFKYYPDSKLISNSFDTNEVIFDSIEIPSMWQFTGYERPVYVNIRYEFDGPLPQIPSVCPAGVYIKRFNIKEMKSHYFLSFLGAAGGLAVYLNGEYVGYSEGSHNTAEFDVTEHIQQDENELMVILYKWSTGSYLECQDMFRNNGIFRDVLLYEYSDNFIYDIDIKTKNINNNDYELTVVPTIRSEGKTYLQMELFDEENLVVEKCLSVSNNSLDTFVLNLSDVKLWSAEIPQLYTLLLTLKRDKDVFDCVKLNVGFRKIQIEKNIFYYNGEKIKLLGVNHHDTNPKTGYVLTAEEMEKDILLMKEYNVNCVRTSHYPPDPIFLSLCDLYGIYVVDEADIETHGMSVINNINKISNDLTWKGHFLDRVKRMYERDKNHPSVTMFSLGNESGGIKCQDYCYNYLKEKTDIPIHYEAACRTKRNYYDVYSQMYTSTEICKKVAYGSGLASKYYKRPFFLCEYAHSMGVGAGELETYVNLFRSADNMLGGCIWEFADHAVFHENQKIKYTYGGDHGERKHDSNFCVDGLFSPERSPHTSAYQMKVCYSPVSIKHTDNDIYILKNNFYFRQLDLNVQFIIKENGVVTEKGDFKCIISPQECFKKQIAIASRNLNVHRVINFSFFTDNKELSRYEFVLSNNYCMDNKMSNKIPEITYSENNTVISVCDGNGKIIFNNKSGLIENIYLAGDNLINKVPLGFTGAIHPDLYRNPIDNDMYMRKNWDKEFLPSFCLSQNREEGKIRKNKDKIYIKTKHYILTPKFKHAGVFITEYIIYENGVIDINYTFKNLRFINVPRLGIQFEMPYQFENITYYGLDMESLSDFHVHSVHSICNLKVNDMVGDYIKPQESSMRYDTFYAIITNGMGKGIKIESSNPFVFNANHFTSEQASKFLHKEEIQNYSTVNVHADSYMMGAGSNSCGQLPTIEHRKKRVYRHKGFIRLRLVEE